MTETVVTVNELTHTVEVGGATVTVLDPRIDVVTAGTQGPAGATGETGATGATGAAGVGIPVGGSTNTVLTKASGTNYDTQWTHEINQSLKTTNSPTFAGQTLNGQHLVNIPASSTIGQIVKAAASHTANLAEWQLNNGNASLYIDNNGTLFNDLSVNPSRDARRIQPSLSSSSDHALWTETVTSNPNPDSTYNNVISIGWNSYDATSHDATKVAFRDAWEYYWKNSTGPVHQSERHIAAVIFPDDISFELRPISISVVHETKTCDILIMTRRLTIVDDTSDATTLSQMLWDGTSTLSQTYSVNGTNGFGVQLSPSVDSMGIGRGINTTFSTISGTTAYLGIYNDTTTWDFKALTGVESLEIQRDGTTFLSLFPNQGVYNKAIIQAQAGWSSGCILELAAEGGAATGSIQHNSNGMVISTGVAAGAINFGFGTGGLNFARANGAGTNVFQISNDGSVRLTTVAGTTALDLTNLAGSTAGAIDLANNKWIRIKDTGGTARLTLGMGADDITYLLGKPGSEVKIGVSGAVANLTVRSGGAISGGIDTMTYASTISLDTTKGNLHKTTTVHATGDATVNASDVGQAGQWIVVQVNNDATSGKTITFGTNFHATGTLVGTASKVATVTFWSDGTGWYETGRTTALS